LNLIITCEHGGNKIPSPYQSYFKNQEAVLSSHRGYDLGALDVFNHLKPLASFTAYSETSRLLIELNRSLHHKNLFSEFSKLLSKNEKATLVSGYYSDYRNKVENTLKEHVIASNKVAHLSIHSFTPVLNDNERHCDIGLLFDSTKQEERVFSETLKKEILLLDKTLNVRFNYPYLGKADGFTTYLRKQCPDNYLGIEIEVNQKFSTNNNMDDTVNAVLFAAIKKVTA
jgi:predicted N-formylglutamate amidohydrolase